MKKMILMLAFISIGLNAISQQTSIGPKLGVNFSNLSNTDDSEMLTGLNAGGFFVYSIVEHFGVSVDVLYSAEGAKFTSQTTVGDALIQSEYKLRLNYVRVPLLANVFFGSLGDKLRPKISFGPSFGFLTGVTNKYTVTSIENGNVTSASYESSNKDDFSSFDLGAIVGAGLNYRVGTKTWLNLDARYNIGTTDINEVKGDEAVKNNVLIVSLGLAFGLSEE